MKLYRLALSSLMSPRGSPLSRSQRAMSLTSASVGNHGSAIFSRPAFRPYMLVLLWLDSMKAWKFRPGLDVSSTLLGQSAAVLAYLPPGPTFSTFLAICQGFVVSTSSPGFFALAAAALISTSMR